jgi:hypothetical protein
VTPCDEALTRPSKPPLRQKFRDPARAVRPPGPAPIAADRERVALSDGPVSSDLRGAR